MNIKNNLLINEKPISFFEVLLLIGIASVAVVYRFSGIEIEAYSYSAHEYYSGLRYHFLPFFNLKDPVMLNFFKSAFLEYVGPLRYMMVYVSSCLTNTLGIPFTDFAIFLPFVFSSLVFLVFVYIITRLELGRDTALIAAAFTVGIPFVSHLARFLNDFLPLVTLHLMTATFMLLYARSMRLVWLLLIAGATGIAFTSDNAFPISLISFAYFFLLIYKRNSKAIMPIALAFGIPLALDLAVHVFIYFYSNASGLIWWGLKESTEQITLQSFGLSKVSYLMNYQAILLLIGFVYLFSNLWRFTFVGYNLFTLILFLIVLIPKSEVEGHELCYLIPPSIIILANICSIISKWLAKEHYIKYQPLIVTAIVVCVVIPFIINSDIPKRNPKHPHKIEKTVGYFLRTEGLKRIQHRFRSDNIDDIDIKIMRLDKSIYHDRILQYYYGFHNCDFLWSRFPQRPANYSHDIPRQIYSGNSISQFLSHYKLKQFDYYILPAHHDFTENEKAHFEDQKINLAARILWDEQEVMMVYSPHFSDDEKTMNFEVEKFAKKFDWEISSNINSLIKSRFITLSFIWGDPFYP